MIWLAVALAIATAAPPAVKRIDVPRALLKVTQAPELSGVVWSDALDRYLAVSDDTGLESRGNRHVPIVVAIDARGHLDPTPIPIDGVERMNDAESICAGPEGTFFIATSHSFNRNARIEPARRQLLHLALDVKARRLRVLGRTDLVLGVGASSLHARLDLPPAPLDIEAVGFHDGALFIGLKSPLTRDKRAVVARLEDPVAVFKAGAVPPAALTRFAALPLCIERGGKRVCQGVADLLFLDDGSLVLVGNVPRGGGDDGGGAIWWAKKPFGDTPPEMLVHFADRKPEGVALTRDRKKVVVVFDRDGQTPEWTEIPIPGAKP